MTVDVFCKESINFTTYYETELNRVVYSIKPVLPGHSLIIPKRHIIYATELNNKEVIDILEIIKKVIPVLLKEYESSESYDIVMQMGNYSGMSVKHLHMHIIPRSKKDSYQVDNNRIYEDIKNENDKPGEIPDYIAIEVNKLRKIFKDKS
jgi:diadenosine tetraphosphate (Ap4A) HIT family hydrolase